MCICRIFLQEKGYKVYDLATKTFIVSRDVIHEHVYPFKYAQPCSVAPKGSLPLPIISLDIEGDVDNMHLHQHASTLACSYINYCIHLEIAIVLQKVYLVEQQNKSKKLW